MIKFSIITITYNAEKVLDLTFNSVLGQTYGNVEHLIIDGASTDDTLLKARDYMEATYASGSGHEVSISSEPDEGIYDAMNKGLEKASGDYLVFLNAGDSLPSAHTLEDIVKSADLEGISADGYPMPAVLYGDTDIVDESGTVLYPRRLTPPERLDWRSFRNGMLVCHQAFYVRTDIAKHNKYNLMYRFSADVDWCIRIMRYADKHKLDIRNLHATVAHYLEQGATTAHHKESLVERYHIMSKYYGKIPTVLRHVKFFFRNLFSKH